MASDDETLTRGEAQAVLDLGILELQGDSGQVEFGPDLPRPELPFSQQEYKERQERLRQQMERENLDLIYLTAPDSMYYFHGYNARYYRAHGSTSEVPIAGTAIHKDHDRLIHFDYAMERILLRSTSIVEDLRFVPEEGGIQERASYVAMQLNAEGWLNGSVGMEFYSHVPNRLVSGALESAFLANGGDRVLDATRTARAVRRVKSPQELAYVEKAARIAEIGHHAVEEILRPGVTELEVYGEAIRAMSRAGGEPAGLPDAVSSGPFLTWHSWSRRRVIQEGDLVMYDPAAVYNRYHVNISRPYFVGEPAAGVKKFFRLVGGAFQIFQETAKAGTPISAVCRELKGYYQGAGIWKFYSWGGGIEQTVAFPPDWVGEVFWDLEQETQGVFLENEVTNFYSMLNGLMIDTFVYEKHRARRLSSLPAELTIIEV
jgi:Xaa-Pro aminopeptidase